MLSNIEMYFCNVNECEKNFVIFLYRREQYFRNPISKSLQWLAWKAKVCAGQEWSFKLFPGNLGEDFFLKIGILSPKVYKRPQHKSMKLHPCPAQTFAFLASHCIALQIGCVKYCSRLYNLQMTRAWKFLKYSRFVRNFKFGPHVGTCRVIKKHKHPLWT